MKILVTGTEGYIGALMVPTLLERGHDVIGLDTGFYRDRCLYEGIAAAPTLIRKDIRQVTESDVEGFDAVIHLAELSNDPLGQLNPAVTYRINHQGSVALARTCKRAGVGRFLYSSSCSVYGVATEDAVTEESPVNPQTAYADCKVLVERDLFTLADRTFSPVALRNATAFGASPRMRFDLVLNNLAGLAHTTGEIRMTSDGTPWRPLVHARDICDAFACCLEAPRDAVHAQRFNVGDNAQNYQVKEVAEIVAKTFPNCAVTFGPSGGDNRSYRVSFDKIARVLPAFTCKRDAAHGAEELREIFERIRFTSKDFEHRAFTRLKQLMYLRDTGQIDEDLFWSGRCLTG